MDAAPTKCTYPAPSHFTPRCAFHSYLYSRHAVSFVVGRYTNYTSNERFRTEMRKHDRQKFGPHDKYAEPVTANHDIGWTCLDPEVYKRDPRLFHPRQMSKEVQYQNALLLGPRHL